MEPAEIENQDKKIDDISTKLDVYAKHIAEEEGYITFEIEKKNLSSKGGSYIGILYEINIKGKTVNGDKETDIFVKHIVRSQVPLTFEVPDVYKRENFIYTNLIKEMYVIQEKFNVPVGDRFKIAKAYNESNDEAIILENLAVQGFTTYYRMDVINLEYAELVTKELARLHGLSLALELKRPDYFENHIKNMDCLYKFDDNWKGFTHNMCLFAMQFLESNMKDKVNDLVDIVDRYPSYMNDNSCRKTICHGDYRHNNIMVKEINGKPTQVIAVDFQITHLGNPVLDFIYFIFWGTDQEFRQKHLDNLKELYHRHLDTYLKYFDIDVEDVFPKKEFERQYKEKLDFGLMISVFYLPFLFPPEDDIPDLTEVKEPLGKLGMNVDKKYGVRFREIVDDFLRWGYL